MATVAKRSPDDLLVEETFLDPDVAAQSPEAVGFAGILLKLKRSGRVGANACALGCLASVARDATETSGGYDEDQRHASSVATVHNVDSVAIDNVGNAAGNQSPGYGRRSRCGCWASSPWSIAMPRDEDAVLTLLGVHVHKCR